MMSSSKGLRRTGNVTVRVVVPPNVTAEEASKSCQHVVNEIQRIKALKRRSFQEVISDVDARGRLLELCLLYGSLPNFLRTEAHTYAQALWGEDHVKTLTLVVMVDSACAPRVPSFVMCGVDGDTVRCAFADDSVVGIPVEAFKVPMDKGMAKTMDKADVESVASIVKQAREAFLKEHKPPINGDAGTKEPGT